MQIAFLHTLRAGAGDSFMAVRQFKYSSVSPLHSVGDDGWRSIAVVCNYFGLMRQCQTVDILWGLWLFHEWAFKHFHPILLALLQV